MSQFSVSIDKEICLECGNCLDICPNGVFTQVDGFTIEVYDEDSCNGCQECVEFCSSQAISVTESLEAFSRRLTKQREIREERLQKFEDIWRSYKKEAPLDVVLRLLNMNSVEELNTFLFDNGLLAYALDDVVELYNDDEDNL